MNSQNARIGVFFAKALAIYGLWYVVYDLWLLPDGRLDQWLSHNVAWMTNNMMSLFGYESESIKRIVYVRNAGGVEVINGCNGLTTVGLFIGFVTAYPGKTWRRVLFIPVGVFVIYATNVFRIVIMLFAKLYWPAAFDPLHGFGLTTIFYVTVFGLWVVWVNYGDATDELLAREPAVDAATQ